MAPEVADDAEVSSDEDEEEQGSDGDETDGKKKVQGETSYIENSVDV